MSNLNGFVFIYKKLTVYNDEVDTKVNAGSSIISLYKWLLCSNEAVTGEPGRRKPSSFDKKRNHNQENNL